MGYLSSCCCLQPLYRKELDLLEKFQINTKKGAKRKGREGKIKGALELDSD